MTIFIQWVIFLNLVLAWLRLDLKNYQVGGKGTVLGEAVCFINCDGVDAVISNSIGLYEV